MFIQIKNPVFFTSEQSGEMFDVAGPENKELASRGVSVFQQLPKGVSEKEVRGAAKTVSGAMSSVLVVQMCLQFVMKGSMQRLLPMFLALQLMKSITIYDIYVEPKLQIYLDELRKFIDFEALDPKFLLQKFTKFDLGEYIARKRVQMTQIGERSGMQSGSILENATLYVVLLALLALILLMCKTCLRVVQHKKVQEVIEAKRQNLMWNGSLDCVRLSYLHLVLTIYAKTEELRRQSEEGKDLTGLPQLIALSCALISLPDGIAAFMNKHDAHELRREAMLKKCGTMYGGLYLGRHPWVKYYYPMFMTKRLLFALVVMVLPDLGCQQIQLLIFLDQFYMMWFLHANPYVDRGERRLVFTNEFCQMLVFYCLFSLTGYSVFGNAERDATMKMFYGHTITGIVLFIVA